MEYARDLFGGSVPCTYNIYSVYSKLIALLGAGGVRRNHAS